MKGAEYLGLVCLTVICTIVICIITVNAMCNQYVLLSSRISMMHTYLRQNVEHSTVMPSVDSSRIESGIIQKTQIVVPYHKDDPCTAW